MRRTHPDSVRLSQPHRVCQLHLDLSAVEGAKHTHHLQETIVQPARTDGHRRHCCLWTCCRGNTHQQQQQRGEGIQIRTGLFDSKSERLIPLCVLLLVSPCGGAGFISHPLPESAASAPVADVTDDDALQTGQRDPLSIELQLGGAHTVDSRERHMT